MDNSIDSEARKQIQDKMIESGKYDSKAVLRFHEYDYDYVDLGDCVRVVDASPYTAESLEMDDEEFQEFIEKIEGRETALVFDVCDDPRWVSIVFEDGLEAFGIHRLTITIVDDDE